MGSLSSWRERKRNLEAERDELTRRLEAVDTEIIKAQAGYGAIHNRDTPILKFPTEVACLIFCEAISALEIHRKDDKIKAHLPEVAISHVCQEWRSTAIGLPILWSSFYYHGPSATPATIHRFKIYLERSNSNPLELWLDFRRAIRDRELHSAVLDMALTVVPRWRLVSIFSDGDSPKPTARAPSLTCLQLKNLHAPYLEHLAVYPSLSSEGEEYLASFNNIESRIFTEGAPMLKSVWLDTSAPALYLPPLSGVTTLRIEFGKYPVDLEFSQDALLAILTLPNLENLSMFETLSDGGDMNLIGSGPGLQNVPLVPMERLRHLRLSSNDPLLFLLTRIRAPLLESIMLQYAWIPEGYGGRDHTQADVVYSFPSLTSLTLLDTTCDSRRSLWHFAQMTSAVRHLNVIHSDSYVADGVLGSMQDLSGQNAAWPYLETLVADFELANGINMNTLFAFLYSHQRKDDGLITRISDTRAKLWKETMYPQITYETMADRFTIEEVPEEELRAPKPWPPGGDGILGRRIDLETDPFVTKSILASRH